MVKRFLIIGDLHGQMPKIYKKDFDAIIAPGDFCSDKGIRQASMKTYKLWMKDPEQYKSWWEIIGKKKARKFINESIKKGREILQYLDTFDVPIYLVPGNWDYAYEGYSEDWDFLNTNFWQEKIKKGIKNIIDLDKKHKVIGEYNIIGYGLSNGPELYRARKEENVVSKEQLKKNEQNYKKLLAKQDKLFQKAKKNKKPIIYLCHNVPFNTPIDKIKNPKSIKNSMHFGSNITRDMIDKYQPKICIAGHMHEHFRACKIKKTTAINAGFGRFVNIYLELEGNKIKKLEFIKKGKIIKTGVRP